MDKRFSLIQILIIIPIMVSSSIPESGIGNSSRATKSLLEIDLELAYCNKVNLREITIAQLQNAFTAKKLTTVQLVQCYLARIKAMNPFLRAVIETNVDAVKVARRLDARRAAGEIIGPLHGIPILLKDNIATGDRMETTAGSVALLGIKPKEDSAVAKLLRNAGAIILGKANLDEFASGRSFEAPSGWSGRGGRTSNAYVLSHASYGSSSGSAVAVASNLVTVTLGTETRMSIVWPSSAAAAVGLKPTLGRVSTEGVIPLVTHQDTVGPITRTANDAAIVFSIISSDGFKDSCFTPATGLRKCKSRKFRVGVLRSKYWNTMWNPSLADRMPRYEEILSSLHLIGITVLDPVIESPGTQNLFSDNSAVLVDNIAFQAGLNDYLSTKVQNNVVKTHNGTKKIETMADIVKYNKQHPEKYDQDGLIATLNTEVMNNETFHAERMRNYRGAQIYLKYVFTKYELDMITFPTMGDVTMPAVAGFPYITVPAGYNALRIPFGIAFMGLPHSEENLLILAYKIEKLLNVRVPSQFLP